jgi:hypothetical protein
MTLRWDSPAPSPFAPDDSKVGVLILNPESRSTSTTYSTLAS